MGPEAGVAALMSAPEVAEAAGTLRQAETELLTMAVASQADGERAQAVGRREALGKRLVREAVSHSEVVSRGCLWVSSPPLMRGARGERARISGGGGETGGKALGRGW